jgi:hypothetical protein
VRSDDGSLGGSQGGRRGGRQRVVGGGLVALAVVAVVALDSGLVPLPASTPRRIAGTGTGSATGGTPAERRTASAAIAARDAEIRRTVEQLSAALTSGSPDAVAGAVAPGHRALAGELDSGSAT